MCDFARDSNHKQDSQWNGRLSHVSFTCKTAHRFLVNFAKTLYYSTYLLTVYPPRFLTFWYKSPMTVLRAGDRNSGHKKILMTFNSTTVSDDVRRVNVFVSSKLRENTQLRILYDIRSRMQGCPPTRHEAWHDPSRRSAALIKTLRIIFGLCNPRRPIHQQSKIQEQQHNNSRQQHERYHH